jgi:hypothetical protein
VNNQSLLTSLSAVPNNNTNWWITPAQATGNEINNLLQSNAFIRAIIQDTDLEQYMSGPQDQVQNVISGSQEPLGFSGWQQ